MSKQYIPQINNTNFIFPNNELAEYDIDIIHEINNNAVSGTVINLSATTATSTGITITYDYTWNSNGADKFINFNGSANIISVHCMNDSKLYFKPWRLIDIISILSGNNTASGNGTTSFTPDMLGLASFTTGTYYFEFRMIGARCVVPICQTLTITI